MEVAMNKLEAVNVTKIIKNSTVLSNINLSLTGGRIYAFCGENGSGKTMLFRVLSGLSLPSSGIIKYNDKFFPKARPIIGVVIENASLFPQFTSFQNLMYLASINKLASKKDIENALHRVGLDPKDKRVVKKYSLGMKQRLLIAQSIMEHPDFLFLDEPTNAIDKDGIELIHRIVREEAARGAVVLLASHIDNDISQLADKCFYMKSGEIVDEK